MINTVKGLFNIRKEDHSKNVKVFNLIIQIIDGYLIVSISCETLGQTKEKKTCDTIIYISHRWGLDR